MDLPKPAQELAQAQAQAPPALPGPRFHSFSITGVGGATGKIGLALADADLNPASRLAYVGILGPVAAGTPLTGGFTMVNSADKKLLFRAVSSPLGTAGLTDPLLKLYDSDGTTVVAQNNDWAGDSTLAAAFAQMLEAYAL